MDNKSLWGLDMQPPSKDRISYQLFYRGYDLKEVEVSSWRTLYRKKKQVVKV